MVRRRDGPWYRPRPRRRPSVSTLPPAHPALLAVFCLDTSPANVQCTCDLRHAYAALTPRATRLPALPPVVSGRVYGIPGNAKGVLIFDPATNKVDLTTIPSAPANGGCCGP